MLQMNINELNDQGVITFPQEARLPKKILNAVRADIAVIKWERETRKYIVDSLRKWVISRNNNYKSVNKLTAARAASADKLLLMLANNRDNSLKMVCAKVVRNMDYIKALAPSEGSRFSTYFKEVIAPIVVWCAEFKAVNNIK